MAYGNWVRPRALPKNRVEKIEQCFTIRWITVVRSDAQDNTGPGVAINEQRRLLGIDSMEAGDYGQGILVRAAWAGLLRTNTNYKNWT